MLPPAQFEQLVQDALTELPDFFQEKMNNIAVLVRSWPTTADLKRVGTQPGHMLLGLYQGIPLTRRTQGYHMVAPDTITLFQGPIERTTDGSLEAIQQQVRRVVIHELAHHFGISDDRLRQLGAY